MTKTGFPRDGLMGATRLRKLAAVATTTAALLLGMLVVASPPALASTTPLLLPQGTAFGVLGHSCGGILEHAYATGFDATSGYPTGDVYLSTTCAGSGRGGRSSTYTAWVEVTWDFTAAVVSDSVLPAAPTVNPTLSAFDAHGNQVYNSGNNAYLVLAPGFVPPPRFTGISVSQGPAAGGTSVTVTGTGFTAATAVSFGTTAAASYTVTSDTSITATSPAAAAGTVDVTVTTPGGTTTKQAGDQFTFVPAPSVSSISPTSGTIYGGTSVTITGANLSGVYTVAFGGVATGFTINSDTSLTATAPPAEEVDTVDVTVTSVGGTSTTGTADRYTYLAPAPPPSVSSISPSSGSSLGGTVVTITGSGFTGTTAVDFGATAATNVTVNSDTSITAVAPPGSLGVVDVTVTATGGTSAVSSGDQYTYTRHRH